MQTKVYAKSCWKHHIGKTHLEEVLNSGYRINAAWHIGIGCLGLPARGIPGCSYRARSRGSGILAAR